MDATEASIRAEYAKITEAMTDSALFGTPQMVKLAKRQAELTPLIELYDRRQHLTDELASSRAALADPELTELARNEIPELEAALETIGAELRHALVPKDPADDKNALIDRKSTRL